MAKKVNREYKKGKVHRDHRKFIIVAEGDREDEYFKYFNELSRRVDIQIVNRDKGYSAAKHFLQRLVQYNYVYGIEPEDLVWFVLDVDKWPMKDIQYIYEQCKKNKNWEITISNPCFEIWLHFHFLKEIPPTLNTAKKLKRNLPLIIQGGYNRITFAKLIDTAKNNALAADINKDDYFPQKGISKVYLLADQLLQFLGRNWNGKYIH